MSLRADALVATSDEGVVAKTGELTEAELMGTVFPHPTLSEMMHEAVLAAYGRTLHF